MIEVELHQVQVHDYNMICFKLEDPMIEMLVGSLNRISRFNTIFVNLGLFGHFETFRNIRPCYSHINIGDYYEI